MATIDLLVQTGSDDAYQSGTAMNIVNTSVANELDATTEWAGMRFDVATQGVLGPPQGATIDTVTLTVQTTIVTTDEPDVVIFGHKVVNSGTFTTTNNDISGRAMTTATAPWDVAELGTAASNEDVTLSTAALIAVIQELVDQPTWVNTSPITLIMQGSATATRDFRFNLFETSQAAAPRLHIEYTPAASGIVRQMMMQS